MITCQNPALQLVGKTSLVRKQYLQFPDILKTEVFIAFSTVDSTQLNLDELYPYKSNNL
jgi:hypothetical protein